MSFAPQRAPAGVDEHGVAGLQRQLLALQRLLQILRRDLVGVRQHRHALQRRDVDQHAAGDERADPLDAELGEPAASRVVVDLHAVVEAAADRLVREAVELRADLADLGDDELLVAAAAVGSVVHERALGVHVEAPRAEERHRCVQHAAELDDLAGLDEPRRLSTVSGFM